MRFKMHFFPFFFYSDWDSPQIAWIYTTFMVSWFRMWIVYWTNLCEDLDSDEDYRVGAPSIYSNVYINYFLLHHDFPMKIMPPVSGFQHNGLCFRSDWFPYSFIVVGKTWMTKRREQFHDIKCSIPEWLKPDICVARMDLLFSSLASWERRSEISILYSQFEQNKNIRNAMPALRLKVSFSSSGLWIWQCLYQDIPSKVPRKDSKLITTHCLHWTTR